MDIFVSSSIQRERERERECFSREIEFLMVEKEEEIKDSIAKEEEEEEVKDSMSVMVEKEKEEEVKDSINKEEFKESILKIEEEVKEIFREAVPSHYLFKIQAFSQLSKNSIEKYESSEFEAGGHNWKLSLYPNGNKAEKGGDGHISLYLMLVDTGSSLPASGELNVFFRLFLFDQIRDRYLIRGDTEGRTRRFHEMKKVWGVPQFVSLAKFSDPSNGYLVDDTCMFGAEVFITKPTRNIECLSMVTPESIVTYIWRIGKFSTKIHDCDYLYSETFTAENHNWKIFIYPKKNSAGNINSMSLYLNWLDYKENPGLKVYADFKLRLRDQISDKYHEYSDKHFFNASSPSWGWENFIGLGIMNDKKNGFLLKDTCIVEAEIKILGIGTKIPGAEPEIPEANHLVEVVGCVVGSKYLADVSLVLIGISGFLVASIIFCRIMI